MAFFPYVVFKSAAKVLKKQSTFGAGGVPTTHANENTSVSRAVLSVQQNHCRYMLKENNFSLRFHTRFLVASVFSPENTYNHFPV